MSYLSSVCGKSILYRGDSGEHDFYWGKISESVGTISQAYPGRCFYQDQSEADTFIIADSAVVTQDMLWLDVGVMTNNTFGHMTHETLRNDSMTIRMLRPADDTVWWASCIDLSATYYGGTKLTVGSDGRLALTADGGSDTSCIIDYGYIYNTLDLFVRVRRAY